MWTIGTLVTLWQAAEFAGLVTQRSAQLTQSGQERLESSSGAWAISTVLPRRDRDVQKIRQALVANKATGDKATVLRALEHMEAAERQITGGKLRIALATLPSPKTLEAIAATGEQHLRELASVAYRQRGTCFASSWQYARALEAFERAEALASEKDAGLSIAIAGCLDALGRIEEALARLAAIEDRGEPGRARRLATRMQYSRSILLRRRGQLARALEEATHVVAARVSERSSKRPRQSALYAALAHANRARILAELGTPDDALVDANAALDSYAEAFPNSEDDPMPQRRAALHLHRSHTHIARRDHNAAERDLDAAAALFAKIDATSNIAQGSELIIALNRANLLQGTNRRGEASKLAREALEALRASPVDVLPREQRNWIEAELLLRLGTNDDDFESGEQKILAAIQIFKTFDSSLSEVRIAHANAHLTLGNARFDRDRELALTSFDAALAVLRASDVRESHAYRFSVAEAQLRRGACLRRLGRFKDAAQAIGDATKIHEALLEQRWDLHVATKNANAYNTLAAVLVARNRVRVSTKFYAKSDAEYARVLRATNDAKSRRAYASMLSNYAQALGRARRTTEAVRTIARAIEAWAQLLTESGASDDAEKLYLALAQDAHAAKQMGKPKFALTQARRAKALQKQHDFAKTSDISRAAAHLDAILLAASR